MNVYAQSKLALTMWSRSMALSLEDGPAIIAVNPGSMLGSKMVKEAYGVVGGDIRIGADIVSRAALGDEFAAASGKYFDNDSRRFASPRCARSPEIPGDRGITRSISSASLIAKKFAQTPRLLKWGHMQTGEVLAFLALGLVWGCERPRALHTEQSYAYTDLLAVFEADMGTVKQLQIDVRQRAEALHSLRVACFNSCTVAQLKPLQDDLLAAQAALDAHVGSNSASLDALLASVAPLDGLAISEAALTAFAHELRLRMGPSVQGTHRWFFRNGVEAMMTSHPARNECRSVDWIRTGVYLDYLRAILEDDAAAYLSALAKLTKNSDCFPAANVEGLSEALINALYAARNRMLNELPRIPAAQRARFLAATDRVLFGAVVNPILLLWDDLKHLGPSYTYNFVYSKRHILKQLLADPDSLPRLAGVMLRHGVFNRAVVLDDHQICEGFESDGQTVSPVATDCISLTGLIDAMVDPFRIGTGTCRSAELFSADFGASGYQCTESLCEDSQSAPDGVAQMIADDVTTFGEPFSALASDAGCDTASEGSAAQRNALAAKLLGQAGWMQCVTQALLNSQTTGYACVRSTLEAGKTIELSLPAPNVSGPQPTCGDPLADPTGPTGGAAPSTGFSDQLNAQCKNDPQCNLEALVSHALLVMISQQNNIATTSDETGMGFIFPDDVARFAQDLAAPDSGVIDYRYGDKDVMEEKCGNRSASGCAGWEGDQLVIYIEDRFLKDLTSDSHVSGSLSNILHELLHAMVKLFSLGGNEPSESDQHNFIDQTINDGSSQPEEEEPETPEEDEERCAPEAGSCEMCCAGCGEAADLQNCLQGAPEFQEPGWVDPVPWATDDTLPWSGCLQSTKLTQHANASLACAALRCPMGTRPARDANNCSCVIESGNARRSNPCVAIDCGPGKSPTLGTSGRCLCNDPYVGLVEVDPNSDGWLDDPIVLGPCGAGPTMPMHDAVGSPYPACP